MSEMAGVIRPAAVRATDSRPRCHFSSCTHQTRASFLCHAAAAAAPQVPGPADEQRRGPCTYKEGLKFLELTQLLVAIPTILSVDACKVHRPHGAYADRGPAASPDPAGGEGGELAGNRACKIWPNRASPKRQRLHIPL